MKAILFSCVLFLVATATPRSALAQGIDPLDTTFVRGVNWGGGTAGELQMMGDSLACNLLHTGVWGTQLSASDVGAHGLRLMLADYNNVLYKNAGHALRMTVWPSAPSSGLGDTLCRFRAQSSASVVNADGSVDMPNDFVSRKFSSVQFGRKQWYRTEAQSDTFHLSLLARRTSSAGDSADVLFTVTVLRMQINRDSISPTCSWDIAKRDTHVFTFLKGEFSDTSLVPVTRSFSWDSVTQVNEWGTTDSTDLLVEWSGKSRVNWYWVRLECSHAQSYFDPASRATKYGEIRDRARQLDSAYGSEIWRIYDEDETPEVTYEALRYQRQLLDSAFVQDSILYAADSLSQRPLRRLMQAEINAAQSPTYHAMLGSKEALIGIGCTKDVWMIPFIDSGFHNDSLLREARQGFNIGYDSYYSFSGSDWKQWQTYELGPVGMQTAFGIMARDALVPAANLRLGGLRWIANPIFNTAFNRKTGMYAGGRTAVSTEISMMFNAAVCFGATGISFFTLTDDHPAASDTAHRADSIFQTGLTSFPNSGTLDHGTNRMPVAYCDSLSTRTDTIYVGHRASFATVKRLVNWYAKNGSVFLHSRFVGAQMHTAIRIDACAGQDWDTITYSVGWNSDTSRIKLAGITSIGSSDDRSTASLQQDSSRFVFYALGQFRAANGHGGDSVDYVFCCNTRCDPRSPSNTFLDDYPPTDSTRGNLDSAWRGTRVIGLPVRGDSGALWSVELIGEEVWDTVVASNQIFTAKYLPGAAHLFRIFRATASSLASADNLAYNNGRRSEDNGIMHAVYRRGKHAYYVHGSAPGGSVDPIVATMGERRIDTTLDSTAHPSVRSLDSAIGVAYEGRLAGRTWVRLACNGHNGNDSAGVSVWATVTIDTFSSATSFEATPVLAPFYISFPPDGPGPPRSMKGFVVSWHRTDGSIGLRAFAFDNGAGTPVLGDTSRTWSGNGGVPCSFPTIVERDVVSANDSCDLGFEEDSSSGTNIWSRVLWLSHVSTGPGAYKVNLVPASPQCVSCNLHAGCSNMHPNISVAHTMPYGYVQRLVWEIDEVGTTWQAMFGWVTSTMSAVRVNGLWTYPVKFVSRESQVKHPSVRVYCSDSVRVRVCDDCPPDIIWSPMRVVLRTLNTISGIDTSHHYSWHWVTGNAQPARIGFYSASSALLSVSATDGIPTFGKAFIPGRTSWTFEHFADLGRTPTLEENGRTGLDWERQREMWLTKDDARARIPLANSRIADSVLVYFGQGQVFNPACGSAYPAISANAGVALREASTSNLQLMTFQAVLGGAPGSVVLRTDTVTPRTQYDTVHAILQGVPADTTATRDWFVGAAACSFILEARRASDNAVLFVVDTITSSPTDLLYRGDTVSICLYPVRDTTMYFALRIEAAGLESASIAYVTVVGQEPNDGASAGKAASRYAGRAGIQPTGRDPLSLTASPNPFGGHAVDVRYVIPVEDADDLTSVKVMDVVGRDVSTLVHDVQTAGPHFVSFNGADLLAGQYIVAVMTRSHVSSRLIVRVK